jgi:LPS-assembly protein
VRLPPLTVTLVAALVCAPPAWTQEAGRVSNWGSCPVERPPGSEGSAELAEDELEILSGRVEFQIDGDARFTDDIILRTGNRTLRASDAQFDQARGLFSVTGDVEFRDPNGRVSAQKARFDQLREEVRFENAEFEIWSVPARGRADEIELSGEGRARLDDVSYTACPIGNDDWLVEAGEIKLDQKAGIASAKDAKFRVRGVPVFYVPYISYPIANERKSGWLIPNFGTSRQRGLDISAPWYWNIAPNMDATITPRFMSERGLQMGGEYRYLTEDHAGTLTGEYLFEDDETGAERWLGAIDHASDLPLGLRGTVNMIAVSDSGYFEDLSSSLASTSQTHLPRFADLQYFGGPWTARLRIEDYQTIDETLLPEEFPYARLPELDVFGFDPNGVLGLSYSLRANVAWFERDVGVTGLRAHILPEVSRAFRIGIVDIEPSVALDHTLYRLRDTEPGQNDSPSRTVPIGSLDISSTFERITKDSKWLQTLEPRVLYTFIPFSDQEDLPVFDTIEPNLNIVQLFRRNRFIGLDRLADTNQLALGISTRLITADTGEEFLRATLGQVRYLSTQRVALPDGLPNDSSSSDYLVELGVRFAKYWRTDVNFQYDSDLSETVRTEARIRYIRDNKRIINASYRFQRDALENVDLALAWPIAEHWNFVGRYNFSLETRDPLEEFVGIEYETCCWAVRGVWRRYLARRTGESDTAFSFQFVLKGFSDPGTAAEEFLGRDTLGFQ